jgi:hypothetical protein
VKVESKLENITLLNNSDDNVIPLFDLAGTSHFPLKLAGSCGSTWFCVTLDLQQFPSMSSGRPLVHPISRKLLSIVEALKLTYSRKCSKSNLTSINYNRILIMEVKYLPQNLMVTLSLSYHPCLLACPLHTVTT